MPRSTVVLLGAVHLAGCYEGLPDHALPTLDGTTGADATSDESGADDGPQPEEEACRQRSPDPLRRLTHTQYVRSVERLSGVVVPERLRNLLAPVPPVEGAFENAADGLVLRQSDADAYQRIAEYVGRFVFESEAGRALITCDALEGACLPEFVASFGALAYRRSLEQAERDRIVAVARDVENTAALGAWGPYASAVELMLQSPNFVFVPEIGVATDADDVVQLQPYELATRLALILWDEVPDRALLDRAEAGELDDAAGRRDVVLDMLADERAHDGLMRFASVWFELDAVSGAPFASAPTEVAAAGLRSDAQRELAALLEQHVVGGDLRDLYIASETWVTPALAQLYGIDVPAENNAAGGTGLVHVSLAANTRRGGVLGTAAILATHASGEQPSLVRRGAYVRRVALCTEPPPPPPDVEMGDAQSEDHSAQPMCWACHQFLDPIGWGLDRYAADGSLREPALGEGYLVEDDTTTFDDAPSLGRTLVTADAFAHCAAEKGAQWVLAKPIDEVENCFVDDLTTRFADDEFHVPSLVARLVASEAFAVRVVPEGDE